MFHCSASSGKPSDVRITVRSTSSRTSGALMSVATPIISSVRLWQEATIRRTPRRRIQTILSQALEDLLARCQPLLDQQREHLAQHFLVPLYERLDARDP